MNIGDNPNPVGITGFSIVQNLGIPKHLLGESSGTNYTSVKADAMHFTAEITINQAVAEKLLAEIYRPIHCANFGGWYAGILHVYSDLLRDWMPIGRHPADNSVENT